MKVANRAKSEFLSSMSHELRTPMNAIMGFGQLMTMDFDTPLNESQKENVTEILKASNHLLELINEVLDLSKIEAGRIDLSIENVLLGDVLGESLQLILPLAQKRGISIKLIRDDNEITINDLAKSQSIVRADYTRLKQVILNFLSNAVKYNTEEGDIVIKCTKTDNKAIRISIRDTGSGLSDEQQEQLFTAFNRLGAENTDIEGTGIGLVITKNIIDLMGGELGVESEIGKGSTFWVELPVGLDKSNKTDEIDQRIDSNISIEESRSVLYIEDNPANLRLVTQLLGRIPNLEMRTAHEPLLGLELAKEYLPDLILLDINLPGIDGFEVLRRLREQDATKNIPVLAISANAMPKDIEKGLEVGFDDYITKPININHLLNAVEDRLV
jgi:CheY-like chemotaxis protein/anti-sigma regulatory factor (Ser/Thr protein kinase)